MYAPVLSFLKERVKSESASIESVGAAGLSLDFLSVTFFHFNSESLSVSAGTFSFFLDLELSLWAVNSVIKESSSNHLKFHLSVWVNRMKLPYGRVRVFQSSFTSLPYDLSSLNFLVHSRGVVNGRSVAIIYTLSSGPTQENDIGMVLG